MNVRNETQTSPTLNFIQKNLTSLDDGQYYIVPTYCLVPTTRSLIVEIGKETKSLSARNNQNFKNKGRGRLQNVGA